MRANVSFDMNLNRKSFRSAAAYVANVLALSAAAAAAE